MRLTGPKIRLWIGYTATVTGAVFLLLALGFAVYEVVFLVNSSAAEGVVVSNVAVTRASDPSTGMNAQTTFCPQFEYRSADGALHRVTSSACSAPPSFTVGQKVLVHYLSSSPDNAQTDSFGAKWGFVLGFGIAAVILLPIGVLLLRSLRAQGYSLDPLSFWDKQYTTH